MRVPVRRISASWHALANSWISLGQQRPVWNGKWKSCMRNRLDQAKQVETMQSLPHVTTLSFTLRIRIQLWLPVGISGWIFNEIWTKWITIDSFWNALQFCFCVLFDWMKRSAANSRKLPECAPSLCQSLRQVSRPMLRSIELHPKDFK